MKNNENRIGKRMRFGRKIAATVMAAVVFMGGMMLAGGTVRAEEAVPFVDISTDLISLSPQAAEIQMNVAARNLPEGTECGVSVADGSVCSVEWVEKETRGYTRLLFKRGEVLGETVVTVFVAKHPEIAREIRVTNKDVADSYVYEGDGSMNISGLNMAPVPYEVHTVSTDAEGYFGLVWKNAAGEMEVLENRAGAFESSSTVARGTEGSSLEIRAAGHWKITMTPVLTETTPTQAGTGNMVSGRFRGDDKTHSVYCANWADKGNFIVWLYDINDHTKKLLANGVGTYGKNNGNIYLDASHSYYISVESRGDWLVEFSD